jgi:hypothetical protein
MVEEFTSQSIRLVHMLPVWWPGLYNSPTVTHACRKRRLKWVPSAWGYSWATLSPGVINTETWSSRLGAGLTIQLCTKFIVTKTRKGRPGPDLGCRAMWWWWWWWRHACSSLYCSNVWTNIALCQQVLITLSNITFEEHTFSCSRIVTDGLTDGKNDCNTRSVRLRRRVHTATYSGFSIHEGTLLHSSSIHYS